MLPLRHQHLKACGNRHFCELPSVRQLVFEATPDSFDKACPCRVIWDSGLACIAVASLCSSIGALCIKLLDGRIPVFEIVVCLFTDQNCSAPCCYLRSHLKCLSCLLQMVRSAISWAVTDALGRAQHITPLYGSRKRYPILALRGTMGAIAMALYYEAFERLMLSEAVSASILHRWMVECILDHAESVMLWLSQHSGLM